MNKYYPTVDWISGFLRELTGRRYCYLVGNGTTALSLAIRSLGFSGQPVALPNNVCYNVPLAVYFSGNFPVYLDVDARTMGVDVSTLAHMPAALIAVHAYGNPCDMQMIQNVCAKGGVPLIEDCAAALGATISGKSVGKTGVFSVFSFGHGKIVSAGHGGALLFDEPAIERNIKDQVEGLPSLSESMLQKLGNLSMTHTQIYNRYVGQDLSEAGAIFRPLALSVRSSMEFRFDSSRVESIARSLAELDQNLNERRQRYAGLSETLAELPDLEVCPLTAGAVPWRLSVLVSKERGKPFRNDILNFFLERKIPVSSWFPPVSNFLETAKEPFCKTPIAAAIGDHILNFWVDNQVGPGYAAQIAGGIQKVISLRAES
ncbi:MAG: DegT/DnrJ/EryC1/StrS family aminotransferase [Spirochaetales bacterium]|nr:DegT/DnrJ/EryC1/StrS family aminotransferase [Spirochaetales bacterium]